jgi:hypothetical protein
VVLFKQMSQEFFLWKGRKKTKMDSVFWQGRKGQRLAVFNKALTTSRFPFVVLLHYSRVILAGSIRVLLRAQYVVHGSKRLRTSINDYHVSSGE